MNTVIWVAQILLALLFFMAGMAKATQPKEALSARMAWVDDFSPQAVRTIGILEVLGALGLILPVLTGILPWLTPLAAAGLAATMIGAALTHLRRKEYQVIPVNLILMAIAVFVVIGRLTIVPL